MEANAPVKVTNPGEVPEPPTPCTLPAVPVVPPRTMSTTTSAGFS